MKRHHYQITIIGIAVVAVTGGFSIFHFSSPTPLSSAGVNSSRATHEHAASNIADARTFPSGSNLTRAEISQLFELFDYQPLKGGQVPPRISNWVNNDTFIFLQ